MRAHFCFVGLAIAASSYDRLKLVEEINQTPGVTWKAGVNDRFKDLPLGAARDLCGVKYQSAEELKILEKTGKVVRITSSQTADLPDNFDSATNWPNCAKIITDIRDQSNCGCCWAFAAAEAASDRMCIATNGTLQMPLSAQDVCFCTDDDNEGCHGGFLYDAWAYIQQSGVVTGGQYNGTGPFGSGFCADYSLPHCHHHGPQGDDPYPDEGSAGCPAVDVNPACPTSCDRSAKSPHTNFASDKYSFVGTVYIYSDAQAIQEAIMNDGPVETAFTVYADFENYVSGVYQHTTGDELGGHAVKITGWGMDGTTPYWKVANSWNPYWGEKGFFRIIRGTDECGIEGQVTVSAPKATWGPFKN